MKKIDSLQAAAIGQIESQIAEGKLKGREALQIVRNLESMRIRFASQAEQSEQRRGHLSAGLSMAKALRALRENDPQVWQDLEDDYEEALGE